MRVQGHSQPLDPKSVQRERTTEAGRARTEAGASAERTSTSRDTAAILDQARALAKRLAQTSVEERPEARERARELLSSPFDQEAAVRTAFSLLQGERSPGSGQSLTQ